MPRQAIASVLFLCLPMLMGCRHQQERQDQVARRAALNTWLDDAVADARKPRNASHLDSVQEFTDQLDSQCAEERRYATMMLGILMEPKSIPDLMGMLQDDDFGVRTYASGALMKLTGRNFGPDLEI